MKPFDALTVRGKARRLRPLAYDALSQYDIDVDRIELILNDLNGIFRIRATGGQSYLLRICLPNHHEFATLQAETIWLQALDRDTDITVPKPVRARTGEFIVTAGAPGVPERRRCMVFSWLRGTTLRQSPTPEQFEQLGRLMARMHDHTDSWVPPAGFSVPRFDQIYPFGDPEGLLGERHRGVFDAETQEMIATIEDRVRNELTRLYDSGRPQVVHGDLHWHNVKVYRGRLQPLDFEDLATAFPIQDIAISQFYSLRNPRFPELRRAFRNGYSASRAWPEAFDGQMDLLMVHRGIDLFNYLLTADFPDREQWFPAFIEDIHGPYREMALRRGRYA